MGLGVVWIFFFKLKVEDSQVLISSDDQFVPSSTSGSERKPPSQNILADKDRKTY